MRKNNSLWTDVLSSRKGAFGLQFDPYEGAVFLFTEGTRLRVTSLQIHLRASNGTRYDRDDQSFRDIAALRTSRVSTESSSLIPPELLICADSKGDTNDTTERTELLSSSDPSLRGWLLVNAVQEYRGNSVPTVLAAVFNGYENSNCIALADTNILTVQFINLTFTHMRGDWCVA